MQLTGDDRLAIQDLLARYAVFLDTGQRDEWLGLFAEDATFIVPGRPAMVDRDARTNHFASSPRGVHLTSAPVIARGATEGSATVTQTFAFRNGQTEAFRTGWYADELVKRDGTWRFKVRKIEFFDA
jgi:3-phenylpropionate/cinnamic acid dioxygenase small subunit